MSFDVCEHLLSSPKSGKGEPILCGVEWGWMRNRHIHPKGLDSFAHTDRVRHVEANKLAIAINEWASAVDYSPQRGDRVSANFRGTCKWISFKTHRTKAGGSVGQDGAKGVGKISTCWKLAGACRQHVQSGLAQDAGQRLPVPCGDAVPHKSEALAVDGGDGIWVDHNRDQVGERDRLNLDQGDIVEVLRIRIPVGLAEFWVRGEVGPDFSPLQGAVCLAASVGTDQHLPSTVVCAWDRRCNEKKRESVRIRSSQRPIAQNAEGENAP